jgi:hypothetical protein
VKSNITCFQIKEWDRHKIDIAILRKKKMGIKKEVTGPKQSQNWRG